MEGKHKNYKKSLMNFIGEHELIIEECDTSIKYHKDMWKIHAHRNKLAEQQKLISAREIEATKRQIAKLDLEE